MNLSKYLNQLQNLYSSSLNTIKKNKKLLALSSILDVIFTLIAVAAVVQIPLFAYDSLTAIFELIYQSTGGILTDLSKVPDLSGVMNNPIFVQHFNRILLILGAALLLLLVAWLIFQSITWFLAHKMIKKVSYKKYIKSFVAATILFFIGSLITLALFLNIFFTVALSPNPLLLPSQIGTLFWIFVLIFFFFTSLAYAKRPEVKIKKVFTKKVLLNYLLPVLSLIALFTILIIVINQFYIIGPKVGAIIALITLPPTISFARILLITSLRKAS